MVFQRVFGSCFPPMGRALLVLAALGLTHCGKSPDNSAMQAYSQADEVLLPGEDWEVVSEVHLYSDAPAVNKDGIIYFSDVTAMQTLRVEPDGSISVFDENNGRSQGMMFGADGLLYTCSNREGKFITYAEDGTKSDLYVDKTYPVIGNPKAAPEFCNDLVVTSEGIIYFTDRANRQVLIIRPGKEPEVVASGYRPNGIIMSPDETRLYTTDSTNPRLWAFDIQPDGTLKDAGNIFDRIFTSTDLEGQDIIVDRPGTDGMTVDSEGRVYVGAFTGIHVFNPDGSIVGLIKRPDSFTSNMTFGGPEFNYLYVTGVNRVYRRKLNATGAPYFQRAEAP